MDESAKPNWDENGELEVVTFDLGEERFAIEAFMVHEIVDMLPETTVPGASPLAGTVVNYRGKIIPVADLRLAFRMERGEATSDSRIIVIETELDEEIVQLGLSTDKVHEVTSFRRADSEAVPAVGLRWKRDYVTSLVRTAEGVVALPDLPVIFQSILHGGAKPSPLPS